MSTLGVIAMTVGTLAYVLWPVLRGVPAATPAPLPLEQLEPPPRED